MKEAKAIIANIKKGQIAPVYFLMGEEPYFIDEISNYIENNVLSEDEKGFNQMVLYGQDITVNDIINNAKRFPMMAPYQVIIIKEAQNLGNSIEELASYVENPTPTTILVICYKYKTLDGRKKLAKILSQKGVLLESKKLYERDVIAWLSETLKERNYVIQPKATQMLVEFLGTDLSRMRNELDKLAIIVPAGSEITPEIIEKNIGISKDFNNFELRSALAERNELKAIRIINYFSDNPKDNPIVVTIGTLYAFFQELMTYHGLTNQSDESVSKALNKSKYFIKEYHVAARNYPMKQVSAIIESLREIDMKSKGVGASLPPSELFKELVIKILR